MKKILSIFVMLFSLIVVASAQAQSSMLRIGCEGNDSGAEIFLNGQFKGECPLDMQVSAGNLQLRLVKKVDASHERIFEQDIRMGDGTVKRIDARLGPTQLNTEGRRIEAQREEAARLLEQVRLRETQQAAAEQAAWDHTLVADSVESYGEYLARHPTGRFATRAKAAKLKVQAYAALHPLRPKLPFAVDESVWRALESSEMYKTMPRPRALLARGAFNESKKYTGFKLPDTSEDRTREIEMATLNDKCSTITTTMKPDITSKTFSENTVQYVCGNVIMGIIREKGSSLTIKSLGQLSGSLFPPRIGAEERFQIERSMMNNPKFDTRTTSQCKITKRMEANQLHASLSGSAWLVRCQTEMTWIGGHNGEPISGVMDEYLIENLGVRVSSFGVLDTDKGGFVIPSAGSQSVIYSEVSSGSVSITTNHRSFDLVVGEPGAMTVSLPPK